MLPNCQCASECAMNIIFIFGVDVSGYVVLLQNLPRYSVRLFCGAGFSLLLSLCVCSFIDC